MPTASSSFGYVPNRRRPSRRRPSRRRGREGLDEQEAMTAGDLVRRRAPSPSLGGPRPQGALSAAVRLRPEVGRGADHARRPARAVRGARRAPGVHPCAAHASVRPGRLRPSRTGRGDARVGPCGRSAARGARAGQHRDVGRVPPPRAQAVRRRAAGASLDHGRYRTGPASRPGRPDLDAAGRRLSLVGHRCDPPRRRRGRRHGHRRRASGVVRGRRAAGRPPPANLAELDEVDRRSLSMEQAAASLRPH